MTDKQGKQPPKGSSLAAPMEWTPVPDPNEGGGMTDAEIDAFLGKTVQSPRLSGAGTEEGEQ